jgi:rSAM/selenodomain-associated transferase 1
VSRRDTVILFVKAQRLGLVKSRLARTIGPSQALRLYRVLSRRAALRLTGDRRHRTVLMVTPDRARTPDWPTQLRRLGQGQGDLGRRMAAALRRLARPRAVVVGSDIPGMRPEHIRRAFQALGQRRFVFGPAADGGYWLIGWRRGRWPLGALAGVRWSTRHALADSIKSLGPGVAPALVDRLRDLDSAADYRAWRRGRLG